MLAVDRWMGESMSIRRWAVVVAVLMVAAACGSDADDEASSTETDPPSTLAASARGVTEDVIRVGGLGIDYEELREMGLVDINRGEVERVWDAFIDDVNDRGGILGRQLELHFRKYSVIRPQAADAVCIELTEDVEVFAVLTGFTGPAQSADDCVANQHETILISETATHEQMLAAEAPWVQIGFPGSERLDQALIDMSFDHGLFDGATVAVHSLASEAHRVPDMVDRLAELGIEVAMESVNDAPTTDPAEGIAQWNVISERMREKGVDTVVIPGVSTFATGQLIDQGLDVQVITSDNALGEVGGFGAHPPEAYAGAVGVFGRLASESFEVPEFLRCVDVFESATGETVIPSPEVPDGDPDWNVPVSIVCSRMALFEQLATVAGTDLTNDSFRAAVESNPELILPNTPYASFGPDKYDGNDGLRLVEIDPTVGDHGGFAALTELQSIAE